ncbi:MAG: CRTAC1 family protein [Planctomycetota bacterium]|nr:MAG: CRTAC1 family protein [Planctomycetota bacterium]
MIRCWQLGLPATFHRIRTALLPLALLVPGPIAPCARAQVTDLWFEDVTAASGIDFTHCDGSSGAHYLVEAVASGMASFDYDRDGLVDVYFLNGSNLEGSDYRPAPTNALYRNLGEFRFTDASHASGLADAGFGLGAAVGDIDNDGFSDVYINNYGANRLYHNNGDGTFTPWIDDVLACGHKVGGGVAMLDIEGDGDLDIYVANYIQFSYAIPASEFRGRTVYGGPLLYPKEPDDLLRNEGDGTFTNISQSAGIAEEAEWGMGVIALDYDDDGDTDIFVANDSTKNFLWENDGTGRFTEVGLLTGLAFDHRGDPQGSMGVDAADVNNDGLLDLFQTAATTHHMATSQNVGSGFFQDATLRWGAGKGTYYPVNWGVAYADFDNDGDRDVFIANGHIHDNMDDLDDTVSFRIANQVLENQGGRRLVDVSAMAGPGMAVEESSRGLVVEDLNLDGKMDVVVLNIRSRPTVLANRARRSRHWIAVELVGVHSNRDAAGSRVWVESGGKTQVLDVHCGRGYQGHFGSRLHFGLDDAAGVDRIRVRWHAGAEQTVENPAVDTLVQIVEPHSVPTR